MKDLLMKLLVVFIGILLAFSISKDVSSENLEIIETGVDIEDLVDDLNDDMRIRVENLPIMMNMDNDKKEYIESTLEERYGKKFSYYTIDKFDNIYMYPDSMRDLRFMVSLSEDGEVFDTYMKSMYLYKLEEEINNIVEDVYSNDFEVFLYTNDIDGSFVNTWLHLYLDYVYMRDYDYYMGILNDLYDRLQNLDIEKVTFFVSDDLTLVENKYKLELDLDEPFSVENLEEKEIGKYTKFGD